MKELTRYLRIIHFILGAVMGFTAIILIARLLVKFLMYWIVFFTIEPFCVGLNGSCIDLIKEGSALNNVYTIIFVVSLVLLTIVDYYTISKMKKETMWEGKVYRVKSFKYRLLVNWLGWLGIHKNYIGDKKSARMYRLVTLIGFGLTVLFFMINQGLLSVISFAITIGMELALSGVDIIVAKSKVKDAEGYITIEDL